MLVKSYRYHYFCTYSFRYVFVPGPSLNNKIGNVAIDFLSLKFISLTSVGAFPALQLAVYCSIVYHKLITRLLHMSLIFYIKSIPTVVR